MGGPGNMTIEEARGLVSDPLLWPRVRDFLWNFAPQVHKSWLCSPVSQELLASPRVKRYVLESLNVEPCFHAFPREDGSRLLLLDGATLESVAKWLGALACADALRHVTDGATVRALKAALPGIYPEVFGYTAYFGEFASRRGAEARSLQTMVAEEGYSLLLSALSNLPPALVARLKYKLPRDAGGSAALREMKFPCIFRLLKLKFPEAHKLCCS